MIKFLFALLFAITANAGLTTGVSAIQNLSIQKTTSATKTPSATGNFLALTSNSITLQPGVYVLTGNVEFTQVGGSANYTSTFAGFYGANGADTGTTPTLLSATSGVTVNSDYDTLNAGLMVGTGFGTGTWITYNAVMQPVFITVTAAATIYLVPYASETTASFARVTAFFNAQRIY